MITIEEILAKKENQTFDRKSFRINVKDICNALVGFVNQDGGMLAVGIEDNLEIRGFKDCKDKINKIREAIPVFIKPPVSCIINEIECKNNKNQDDVILIIEILPGSCVHTNQKDEAYLRCGQGTSRLNFDQRINLERDKGNQVFEKQIVENLSLEDLDRFLLEEYANKSRITYSKLDDILLSRNLAEIKNDKLVINNAGLLLFANYPSNWIERARVRVLRYEGEEEKTGRELNTIKDENFEGNIITQIKNSTQIINSLLRDFSSLGDKGVFIKTPEYPEFAWMEALINALVHREYGLSGSDINIKIFENRMEVISPGNFPSTVNEDNILDVHFSRNPRIARVLSDLGYVKELGEGVNRMFEEMSKLNLPDPEFIGKGNGVVKVILRNNIEKRRFKKEIDLLKEINHPELDNLSEDELTILTYVLENKKVTTKGCSSLISKSEDTARNKLKKLTLYKPPFLKSIRETLQDPKGFYSVNSEILLVLKDKEIILKENKQIRNKQEKLFQ